MSRVGGGVPGQGRAEGREVMGDMLVLVPSHLHHYFSLHHSSRGLLAQGSSRHGWPYGYFFIDISPVSLSRKLF